MLKKQPAVHPTREGIVVILAGLIAGGCEPLPGSPAARPQGPSHVLAAADVSIKPDETKLDADRKYERDGDMMVSGLFQKDGANVDQVVHVYVTREDGKVRRRYEIDLTEASFGAAADMPLNDGSILTVSLPRSKDDKGSLKTRPDRITATALRSPDGRGLSMCVVGRDVLAGGLRFITCGIGNPGARLSFGFIDAEPQAAAQSKEGAR